MLVLGVSCHVCEDSSGRNTVGLGGPCVLMKVGPRALGKVGGGGGGPLVNMGAGGDGPCLLSWLLRCAETSLSKWNPQPDWQAGRRAPSNRSSQPESKRLHFEITMLWKRHKQDAGWMGIVTHFGCSSGGFQVCPGTRSLPQSAQRTGNQLGMHPGKVEPKMLRSFPFFLLSSTHKGFWEMPKGRA